MMSTSLGLQPTGSRPSQNARAEHRTASAADRREGPRFAFSNAGVSALRLLAGAHSRAVGIESERAIDLCVLTLLELAPALALDPAVSHLGWDELAATDVIEVPAEVIAFACSPPARAWARHMDELDHEDRSEEWDAYRSETLILAEVVIRSIEVFDHHAGWENALACERAIDHYRDQIWDRSDRESLSKALSHGVSFGDLAHTAITNGQRWARTCAALHERSHQPWPPEAPRTPPPA